MFWFTARTQNTFTVYPISLCMCFSLQSIVIDMKTFSLLCSLSTIHRFVTVTLSETLCSLLEWMCAKKIRACVCMRSFLDFCAVLLCGSVPLDVLVCEFFSHRKNTIVLTTQTEKEIWNHIAKNSPRILTEMMKKAINQSDCWPKTWRQRKKRS